jgi:hypothetical protein
MLYTFNRFLHGKLEIEGENEEGTGYENKGEDDSAISSSPPSKSEVDE